MAESTAISWCDATFNPWWGCQKVSPACDHCYAERDSKRFAAGRVLWGVGSERRIFDIATPSGKKHWDAPLKWAKSMPAKLGRRPRVFCASMGDWLDLDAPIGDFVVLLDTIRLTPELDWLLLSKRIGNWRKRLEEARRASTGWLRDWIIEWLGGTPPANVWLGATVVNQEEADRDVPKLLAVPARMRFLSVEPMLGSITLPRMRCDHGSLPGPGGAGGVTCPDCAGHGDRNASGCLRLHWVICGGESGPHARPMHPAWVRSLRDQCAAAGVPFHFKQHGEWCEWGTDGPGLWMHSDGRTCSDQGTAARAGGVWTGMFRAGKAAAGRLLDGVEHNGFPR